jgi:hypothetical protein
MKSCILKVIDLCSKGSEEGTGGGAEANITTHAPMARERGVRVRHFTLPAYKHTTQDAVTTRFVVCLAVRCCCQDIYIIATDHRDRQESRLCQ